ncbi:unnamed protein product [Meloidogyne enterolobii]|uniref:Uncharacterized protein n=2 Tax=Meloidogyne enterolobii TaxID=390850 RepID=A0A6V7XGD7_MELEN|nr:unnamed protein product [Meloidogyne enterolobii]
MGVFNANSILQHITRESMPLVLDIGNGFTTDLVIRPEPTLFLIYNSNYKTSPELRTLFSLLPSKLGNKLKNNIKLVELDKAHSLPLEGLLIELGLSNKKEFKETAVFCVLLVSSIHCVPVPTVEWFRDEFTNNIVELLGHAFLKTSDNNEKITDGSWQRFFPHKIDFENKPHPLMQLQLEQINKIFGGQQIKIKPEPISEHHHNLHNFDGMDNEKAAISGCPMMAHLNNIRDEL